MLSDGHGVLPKYRYDLPSVDDGAPFARSDTARYTAQSVTFRRFIDASRMQQVREFAVTILSGEAMISKRLTPSSDQPCDREMASPPTLGLILKE
jgi:hypothetical protein